VIGAAKPANGAGRDCGTLLCLEDLTARYSRPCVLDVKLGNVQHGHDAPVAKAARSLEKCKRTTSKRLGFRLCGSKVSAVRLAMRAVASLNCIMLMLRAVQPFCLLIARSPGLAAMLK